MTDKQFIEQLLKDFELLKKENARLVLRLAELEENYRNMSIQKTAITVVFQLHKTQIGLQKVYEKNLIKKLESKKDIREVN